MLDAYAATPADVAALAPVWWALEDDERGTFYAHPTPPTPAAAQREGLWPLSLGTPPRDDDPALLVTGDADHRPVYGRRLVILDGAVDETPWKDDDPGHLVLTASPRGEGTIPVGVPRFDYLARPRPFDHDAPAVAVVLGALDLSTSEQVQVFDGWAGALAGLGVAAARDEYRVVVHATHPDVARPLQRRAAELGLAYTHRLDDALSAAVCVSDDRRLLFAFAAYRGPVVPLCDPWRPDPAPPALGLPATHPSRLVEAVGRALADTAGSALRRKQTVARVYPHADGHAADRAADAIRRHVLI